MRIRNINKKGKAEMKLWANTTRYCGSTNSNVDKKARVLKDVEIRMYP